MSNKKSIKTEEINEAIEKGLQNFREAADASPTVNPTGYDDPAIGQDAEGKAQALGTLDTSVVDNSAMNMATIAAKPSNAMGGGVAPKASKKEEESEEEEMQEDAQSIEDYLASLFDEDELSESFMKKLALVFETALQDRINFIEEAMQESFNEALNEQVETIAEELSEKLDEFLSYVVNEWTEENKVAIERGIKADIAESFMAGLKELFETHYIEMPDEQVNVIDELLDAKKELEEQLNDQINNNIKLMNENNVNKARNIFNDYCQDMTDTEIERFYSLVENIEFENEQSFSTKLRTIKESFLKGFNKVSKPVVEQPSVLTEDIQEVSHSGGNDPLMEAYSRAFTFQNRNKNG